MPTSTLYQSTPLGTFTLQADNTGLCALLFPKEHETSFNNSAASETAIAVHLPLLEEAAGQLLAYLDGRLYDFDLPISLGGTAFQRQVWQQLQTIPYGETRSYGNVAAALGSRNKARAVGGAAHANPLGIIIPCHRLIGASGALTGFGGGLDMKHTLLALEQRHRRR